MLQNTTDLIFRSQDGDVPRNEEPDWFPLYVDVFVSDGVVEAMTTREVGAYLLLLCKAWREKPPGSIPSDDRVLARWARLTPDEWSECRTGVLAAFKPGTDSRLHQVRLRLEYDNAKKHMGLRSLAGKVGAEKRWQTHSKRIATPSTSEVVVDVSSSSSSGNGGSGGKGADGGIDTFVSPEMIDFATQWKGRPLVPQQLVELAGRVQQYGEAMVSRCMEIHLNAGTALGNWKYLDAILANGGRERKAGTIAGVNLDEVLKHDRY
jgi:uncharacterized protein YdaU (DUF1376 family)